VLDKPDGKLGFGGKCLPVKYHTCVFGPFGKHSNLDLEIMDHIEYKIDSQRRVGAPNTDGAQLGACINEGGRGLSMGE
jgi:hypothetical protein